MARLSELNCCRQRGVQTSDRLSFREKCNFQQSHSSMCMLDPVHSWKVLSQEKRNPKPDIVPKDRLFLLTKVCISFSVLCLPISVLRNMKLTAVQKNNIKIVYLLNSRELFMQDLYAIVHILNLLLDIYRFMNKIINLFISYCLLTEFIIYVLNLQIIAKSKLSFLVNLSRIITLLQNERIFKAFGHAGKFVITQETNNLVISWQ